MSYMGIIFEKLIINTLNLFCNKKYVEEINDIKELKSKKNAYDYIVKSDIDILNLKKGTNIEIKLFINEKNYYFINKHYNDINVVIICFLNALKFKEDFKLRVIDIDEIKPLIDLYPIENTIFFNNITKNINLDDLSNEDYSFYKKIKEVFCRDITQEIIDVYNSRYIGEIKEKLKKQNINLFLGTGISLDFGADSWNKLSDNLVDYLNLVYINNVNNVKNIIGNNNYSNTLLVKKIFPNYEKALYNCIYKKYTGIHPDNNTMRAVTTFLYKYPNTNVITYNYDEFLEKDINMKFKDFKAISRYEGGKYPPLTNKTFSDEFPKNIEINHVHGFVPYRENQWNTIMKKSIILNQLDYFGLYRSRANWGYKIQYESLKKGVSVFVGSSLSDIFLVKILNDTKKIGKKYAFMYGGGITAKDKYNVIKYFKELNVDIIWCDDFNKIHAFLINM